jgi:DNA polymerase V
MYDVELIPVPKPLGVSLLPVLTCQMLTKTPSPTDDYVDGWLDLNMLLLHHTEATYLVRVTGESMAGAKIHAGDLLAVDKHLPAEHGHIVVAVIGGDCTVRRLELQEGTWWLVSANPAYQPYKVPSEDVHTWGVVTHIVREILPGKLALLHSRD